MPTMKSPLDRTYDAVALTGLAGWLLLVLVLHLVTDNDIFTDAISLYAIGDYGFLLTAAFLGLGLAHLALAARIRRRLGLWLRPSLLAIVGLCTLGSGVFPTDPKNAESLTTRGMIHLQLGLVGFLVMAVTPLVFAASLRRTTGRRAAARVSRILGCGTVGAFLAMPLIFRDAYFGIGQRLFVAIYLSWLTVMTLSVARSQSARVDHPQAGDIQPSVVCH